MRMLKFDAEQTQAVLVLTQRLMEAEARINELSRSYGCAAGQERSPK
jgi:hypothetical protein